MAYEAIAIKVAVASPGDTVSERDCTFRVIHRWNTMHSENFELVLMPIGWETHATPDMGKSAQDLINSDIIDDADLLIGIFGARLGTPTANAPSGTVEEIRCHFAAGKPTMVYFSSGPIPRQDLNAEQFAALQEFENECKANGLIDYFASTEEFREKLDRHLTQTVTRKILGSVKITGKLGADAGPTLSKQAQDLLVALSEESDGYIYVSRTDGGHVMVAVNNMVFADGNNQRESARWEAAVDELYNLELTDGGSAHQVINIKHAGYEMADRIKLSRGQSGDA